MKKDLTLHDKIDKAVEWDVVFKVGYFESYQMADQIPFSIHDHRFAPLLFHASPFEKALKDTPLLIRS